MPSNRAAARSLPSFTAMLLNRGEKCFSSWRLLLAFFFNHLSAFQSEQMGHDVAGLSRSAMLFRCGEGSVLEHVAGLRTLFLGNLSICLSFNLSIYLSTYPPIYLPTYLPIYLPIYLSIYLPIYLSTYLPIYLSTYLSIYLQHLSIHLSIYSIYLSTVSIYVQHLSIYSIYLSTVSIYLQ